MTDQALSSFGSLARDLNRAEADEINAYRTWAEKHAPVEKTELRFLNHPSDLLAVSTVDAHNSPKASPGSQELEALEPSSKPAAEPTGATKAAEPNKIGEPLKIAFLGLPLVLLLPIIAFAIVPDVLARLVMMVLIGLAEAAVVTNTELANLMDPPNWITCASM